MINTNYSISNKTFFTARSNLRVNSGFRENMLPMIEAKKAESANLLIEMAELKPAYIIKKKEFMQIAKKINLTKPRITDFKKALKNAENKIKKTTDNNLKQKIVSNIEAMKVTLLNLATERSALEAEYKIKKQEFSEITKKISLIKTKIATLKASIKNAEK